MKLRLLSTESHYACDERATYALTIEGVDVLDGTPLLDIKPYVPDFDLRTENVRVG